MYMYRHGLSDSFFHFTYFHYRLVVPNKGYSSLDQSPDEKPLVALDTDRYDTLHTKNFTLLFSGKCSRNLL